MSQDYLCRLCVNICQYYESIYDENGHGNDAYQLMMKYFEEKSLNITNGVYLTVVCSQCWHQLSDFHSFQQSVYQAQQRLNDAERHPEIQSDGGRQEINIKKESDITKNTFKYNFDNQSDNVVTNQVEEDVMTSNEDVTGANVKQEYPGLINNSENTPPSEYQSDYFSVETSKETSLTLPKLEIMDVSQDAMSDESDNPTGCDSNECLAVSSKRQNQDVSAPIDALTKKKFIEDSDAFIKKWKASLRCVVCTVTCSTYSLLRQHFLDKHPLEKCYIVCCQRKIYQRYVVEDHIRYHIDPDAFKCDQCDKRYTARRQLAEHVRNHHSNSNEKTKKNPRRKVTTDREIDDIISRWKPILECAVCKQPYKKLKQLQLHFRDNHPQYQFYIECCYRKLKKRYDIEDHARNHINPTTTTCEICNCPFSTQSNLTRHMRSQHSKLSDEDVKSTHKKRITDQELEDLVAQWKPNLECVQCRMKCPTLKMLQLHFRLAHPVKQFYIECCHRKFKRRYDIEFHARSHVDPVNFTCEICTNRFSTQSNLIRHVRIYHTNSNGEIAVTINENS